LTRGVSYDVVTVVDVTVLVEFTTWGDKVEIVVAKTVVFLVVKLVLVMVGTACGQDVAQ